MGGILQAVLIVLVAGAVIVLVFDPLRRRAGQNDSAQMFNEIHCARSSAEADEVFWRAICTYQVWALTLNLIGTVIFVLDLFGVIDAL